METINRPDLDLVLLQDLEFEIQCESDLSHHKHAHTADWILVLSCGHSVNLCESRRQEYVSFISPLTICVTACGDVTSEGERWLPIE